MIEDFQQIGDLSPVKKTRPSSAYTNAKITKARPMTAYTQSTKKKSDIKQFARTEYDS